MGLFDTVRKAFSSDPDPEAVRKALDGMTLQEISFMMRGGQGQAMASSPFTVKQEEDANFKSKFPWLFDPHRGVRWDFNPIRTRNLAQDDTWVQMLVTTMVREMANTPWQIVENENPEVAKNYNPFERVAKGYDSTVAKQDGAEEIRELLENPNPDEDFTDLITQIAADQLEVGSLAIAKMFSKRDYEGDEFKYPDNPEKATLVHIKPTDPITFTKDYEGKTGITSGYWQFDKNRAGSTVRSSSTAQGQQPVFFDTTEIVWDDINPRTNRRYGLPPSLTVQDILMLLDLTIEQEQRYWSRGAFPAGMVATDGDISEIDALKEQKGEMEGRPEKQMLHVSDPDADFIPFSFTWSELDMTAREKWYAKVIASAFRVPVSVVGLKPEEVNRSTFEGERGNFESNTLGPKLQNLERVINSQIIKPHFGDKWRFEFKPGMSEAQRKSISDRVRQEFTSEIITRNEARKALGLEEAEEDGFKSDLTDDGDGDGPNINLSFDGDGDPELKQEDDWTVQIPSYDVAVETNWDGVDKEEFVDDEQWASVHVVSGPQGIHLPVAYREDGKLKLVYEALNSAHDTVTQIPGIPDGIVVEARQILEELKEREYPDREPLDADGNSEQKCAECGDELPPRNSTYCSKGCHNRALSKDDGESPGEQEGADTPLRGTGDWHEFELQPGDIDDVHGDLEEPMREAFEQVMASEEIDDVIETMAAEQEDDDTEEKSTAALRRQLSEVIEAVGVADLVKDQLMPALKEKVREAFEGAAEDTGLDADSDPVLQRIEEKDMQFADNLSKRMESEIREVVAEGWKEDKTIDEIKDDIMDRSQEFTENHAELIARDQMQRATGEARNEFAQQHSDKFGEVWMDSGDDRVRPAHQEMDGKWKRASEDWVVPYETGEMKEAYPGDSEKGIQCRCDTKLVPLEELDDSDHAGA